MELNKYITQPYTELSSKKWKWSVVLITGLGVFVFLFLFKPSPYIYEQEAFHQFLISFGFGIVTSIILFISKFLIEPKIVSDKWTLGKSIIWGLVISATIGIASFFYIVIIFENNFSFQYLSIYLKNLLYSILTALIIGSIPISIHHLINYTRTYRKALKKAGLLDDEQTIWEEEVIIKAGKEANNFSFDPREIVYISADDNYISVFSLESDSLKKVLIRGTLKSVERELKRNSQFLRCHKSYIINMRYFKEIRGNSQNMRLISQNFNLEVPVSRSKSKLISEKVVL